MQGHPCSTGKEQATEDTFRKEALTVPFPASIVKQNNLQVVFTVQLINFNFLVTGI